MAVPLRPPRSRPRPPRAPVSRPFLVLTERNLELLWRDNRTAWLLALQAPIVALFILVGFANKPYQEKMLVPRPLEPEELAALEVVDRMSAALPADDKLTERVKEIL